MSISTFRRKAKIRKNRIVRGVVSKRSETRKKALRHIYPTYEKGSFLLYVGTPGANVKIKRWRLSVGLSAAQLAKRLGHHRTYVKHLESASRPWLLTEEDACKLDRLAKELKKPIKVRAVNALKMFSLYVLSDGIVNLVRPRRCRGHNQLMLFPSPNQVYCDRKRECKKFWRRKEKGSG